MERRKFSREFKIEAVKLVRERGVKVAQAARDLDVHATVLRSWVREFAGDPREAFPGNGQMKTPSGPPVFSHFPTSPATGMACRCPAPFQPRLVTPLKRRGF